MIGIGKPDYGMPYKKVVLLLLSENRTRASTRGVPWIKMGSAEGVHTMRWRMELTLHRCTGEYRHFMLARQFVIPSNSLKLGYRWLD
ncbi:hypothetical protein D3C72_1626670 [compost metagenome]